MEGLFGLIGALAWPIVVYYFINQFKTELKGLLNGFIKIFEKTNKIIVNILGQVYIFEADRTKELIESSIELITNMNSDERKLLRIIEKHGDQGLLLTSNFERTKSKNRPEDKYHETLQSLHYRSLISN